MHCISDCKRRKAPSKKAELALEKIVETPNLFSGNIMEMKMVVNDKNCIEITTDKERYRKRPVANLMLNNDLVYPQIPCISTKVQAGHKLMKMIFFNNEKINFINFL